MARVDQKTLTTAETELLAKLLQGQKTRSPLRAAVRLVSKQACRWTEPEGDLVLTPEGRELALHLWPGVAAVAPEDEEAEVRPSPRGRISVSPQLALALPHGVARPRPVDALLGVLGGLKGAQQLVEVVLEHYPHGRGLATANKKALLALGLPHQAASRITAAFELSRACHVGQEHLDDPVRHDPAALARALWVSECVEDLEVEHFWTIALDVAGRVISIDVVAKGSLSRVEIEMRDVFVSVVRARAAAFYVSHNHPSGKLRYTDSDVRLTQRIKDCAARLGIHFVDHVIIAPDGRFVSLKEEGAL